MRIRRNIEKLLGIVIRLPWRRSSSQAPALQPPEACICPLNQSPWDVYPSPPPSPTTVASDDQQPPTTPTPKVLQTEDELAMENEMETKETDESVGNEQQMEGQMKEGAVGPMGTDESVGMDEAEELSIDGGEEISMAVKRGKRSSVRKKTHPKKDDPNPVVAAPTTCKKTDGKKWHCKRQAQHPYSFCEYHLAQLRSYNGSATSTHKRKRQRKAAAAAAASAAAANDNGYFYYYSSFGPWRAKERSARQGEEKERGEAEEKGGDSDKEGDSNTVGEVEEEGRGDSDDSDVGSTSLTMEFNNNEQIIDSVGRNNVGVDTSNCCVDEIKKHEGNKPKKKRKVVKARSLKSLM